MNNRQALAGNSWSISTHFCAMKSASISDIKGELRTLNASELLEVCLRLAKSKKENKELLTYLLFESHDADGYIQQLKEQIDATLKEVNKTNLYLLKKQLRKLLTLTNKHLKFMASKVAEVEVLLYFCNALHQFKIPYKRTLALSNLYDAQLKKINMAIGTLHEDLQHDFSQQLSRL